MKRSEMVEKLSKIDFEWWAIEDEIDFKNLISKLLDAVESLGMLPPQTEFTDPGHFPGDNFKYEINEWEPEDL